MTDPKTPGRLPEIDYDAFANDITKLGRDIRQGLGEEDIAHLKAVIRRTRLFTLIGYATAWICPNPISAYCISQGIFGRWLVTHHISHGGYDNVPNIPRRYTSKVFAQGWRRFIDWFDWILPEAWHVEHDLLHHGNTSETKDPDVVEDHALFLRQSNMPRLLKYAVIAFLSVSWKIVYYAPNTLRALEEDGRNAATSNLLRLIWDNGLNPLSPRVRKLWLLCYLPYALVAFILIPAVFLIISPWAVISVFINRILAEMMTNLHSFLVISPNHSGDDLYRFDYHFKGKGEYCVNQVISSCNYHTGSEWGDYLQIWLNYQIEHHLYPGLPMLAYRKLQPQVKALCETHQVPYIQESVFKRVAKMIAIIVGKDSMKWIVKGNRPDSDELDSSEQKTGDSGEERSLGILPEKNVA
ncbi:hypothetical protein BVX99_01550 [bacterium F16]|nr:hypothetical protein BVX99_01550 [bacterium F16]